MLTNKTRKTYIENNNKNNLNKLYETSNNKMNIYKGIFLLKLT